MKKKRLKLIAVLLLICVFLAGCGIPFHVYTDRELEQVAAKLLEEKYGEDTWSRSSTTFFADCAPADETEIVFELIAEKNGDALLADGYVLGILEQQINSLLVDDIQKVFQNSYSRAYFPDYYHVPEIDSLETLSLKEYLKEVPVNFVGYEIYVDIEEILDDSIDDEYNFFSQLLQDKINQGLLPDLSVHIFFVDQEMLIRCKEYYSTSEYRRGTFSEELKRYSLINIRYNEGKINITNEDYKIMREGIQSNEK